MRLNLQGLTGKTHLDYIKLEKILARPQPNKVIDYIPHTDFRLGHDGLKAILKKKGINPEELKAGEMVIFTNSDNTAVKLFGAGNTILYQKVPNRRRLIYSAILLLPKYFNGKTLDLPKALDEAVRNDHDQRVWKKTGVTPKRVSEGK